MRYDRLPTPNHTTHENFSWVRSGFTLIELLVVITLVGAVSGIGIVSLVNYGQAQLLETAAGDVRAVLSEARFNALSSVYIETSDTGAQLSCPDADTVEGYRVELENVGSGDDSLQMFVVCSSENILVTTVTLPRGASFGTNTSCSEITYEMLTGTAFRDAPHLLPCTIEIEAHGNSQVLEIDALGNIVNI